MAEVMFYHLTEKPLESALPEVLEKTLERGWRAVVRGTDRRRLDRLDAVLWTRRDDDFLPHGVAGGAHDADQPILLTDAPGNPNAAQVLMLVDGARVVPDEAGAFDRLCLFFDANDPDQLGRAREDWKGVKSAGLKAQYWAQEAGRWSKKAETGA